MIGNGAKEQCYLIVVRGYLQPQYAAWFEGMALAQGAGGVTELCGKVADQAALHGLLSRIRDLGLVLLLVRQLGAGGADGIECNSSNQMREESNESS